MIYNLSLYLLNKYCKTCCCKQTAERQLILHKDSLTPAFIKATFQTGSSKIMFTIMKLCHEIHAILTVPTLGRRKRAKKMNKSYNLFHTTQKQSQLPTLPFREEVLMNSVVPLSGVTGQCTYLSLGCCSGDKNRAG